MATFNEPSPRSAPATTALGRVAFVWAALVAIIPVAFGVVMLVSPAAITTPGATATDVFHAMAYRNFAFSAVLAAVLLRGSRRSLAWILVARGLTEWADGCSGVFGASLGATIAPFVGGAGDLLVAYYFSRTGARAS